MRLFSQSTSVRFSLASIIGVKGGIIAEDIANAGLATAMMLSPLAAIICTFGEYLLASSSFSPGSSFFLY